MNPDNSHLLRYETVNGAEKALTVDGMLMQLRQDLLDKFEKSTLMNLEVVVGYQRELPPGEDRYSSGTLLSCNAAADGIELVFCLKQVCFLVYVRETARCYSSNIRLQFIVDAIFEVMGKPTMAYTFLGKDRCPTPGISAKVNDTPGDSDAEEPARPRRHFPAKEVLEDPVQLLKILEAFERSDGTRAPGCVVAEVLGVKVSKCVHITSNLSRRRIFHVGPRYKALSTLNRDGEKLLETVREEVARRNLQEIV